MKIGYYKADSINGVWFYGEYLDEPEAKVWSPYDFYDLLPVVGDDEEITTFIGTEDNEAFEAIEREYGIN